MRATGPAVVLADGDRSELLRLLESMDARTQALDEAITVASARCGVMVGGRTLARLDAIRTAVAELRGTVLRTPVGGD